MAGVAWLELRKSEKVFRARSGMDKEREGQTGGYTCDLVWRWCLWCRS